MVRFLDNLGEALRVGLGGVGTTTDIVHETVGTGDVLGLVRDGQLHHDCAR